jgi:molybdopterin-guanine dinucleotide biosynthesis protein A
MFLVVTGEVTAKLEHQSSIVPWPEVRVAFTATPKAKPVRHRSLCTVQDFGIAEQRAFVGAVLTGGYANRMGRDKALLTIEGVPMAIRVARAMLEAGAREVCAVGGDATILGALGLRIIPDQVPHEGPLAGIIGALRDASEEVVVVTACDMPWIRQRHVTGLVLGIGSFDAAMSAADGQLQPLHTAWKRATLPKLEESFRSGERSPLRAIQDLDFSVIDFGAGSWSIDLDTPGDVASASSQQN